MIFIPELETVVICPPRTGSTSFSNAIAAKYPESFRLYHHMEADAIPQGYDRWHKVGIVRHPVTRLWSLFNYLKHNINAVDAKYEAEWYEENDVRPGTAFSWWIVSNNATFTLCTTSDKVIPKYSVRHAMPETKKSQFHTLRPDLGTEIFIFDEKDLMADLLGIELPHENGSMKTGEMPPLTTEAKKHIEKYFKWDLEQFR